MTGLLHGGLEGAADRFGDRDAVLFGDGAWTFQGLDEAANGVAGGLATGKTATVALEAALDATYPARISRVDSLARPRV